LRAITLPMLPTPMNPTRAIVLLLPVAFAGRAAAVFSM
jgi:hypothetical protein